MIRICRRLSLYRDESLYEAVHKACLSRFLPSLARNALAVMLAKAGILPPLRRRAAADGAATADAELAVRDDGTVEDADADARVGERGEGGR